MFVDLSGFTPLTESLMREGSKGAEQLSLILNEIFEPLVNIVYAKGGFIPYYAGDAFTAIFPVRNSTITAEEVVRTALAARNHFSQRESKFGNFKIGVKVGLSHGQVEWGIVGQNYRSYYFRGLPIDQSAECQTLAKDQEIILDALMYGNLMESVLEIKSLKAGFYQLLDKGPSEKVEIVPTQLPELDKTVLDHFYPESVIEYDHDGEFRTVVTVFISFKGVETHELLEEFATVVMDEIASFSGYFKEIDFGDKGGVMVGIYGAPVSFENNAYRALEFILSIREELDSLQQKTNLEFKAGITIGTAYTGFIGGKERCQYAAVGNRVNLAARLMTYADWGEILVDSEIQKNRQFNFEHKGDIQYKGIKGNVPTFKLMGRNYESRPTFASLMVGRQVELEQLIRFASPLYDGKTSGIAVIFGEAGIGKSRLTHELKQILTQEQLVQWFTCPTDQILKKPFNPFTYFLKNYFAQSTDQNPGKNASNFEKRYQELLSRFSNQANYESVNILKELVRTKSVLGALVGIHYPNSLWEQLDAKGRYQNSLSAITNLFKAEASIRPLIIELEDGHWLDDNSQEMLNELVRNMSRFPILLIVTSRYRDDGSKPLLISPSSMDLAEMPKMEINLNVLQRSSVRKFAEMALDGPISNEFYELLLRSSNSNPFYLEQILEYFSESNLLEFKEEQWTIKDKNIKLSSSINAILTARIDRLSTLVKETVKAAAVIGREFELPILNEVMKSQEAFALQNGNAKSLLKEQIQTAEQGQIWRAMTEYRYIFRHSLLREAAYSMQLRTRLKQLHQLIAEAIERIYSNKLEERFVDLAFHYEQAAVFDKTCEYLHRAADFARSNYQNQQALDYYEKLLGKLGQQSDSVREIQTYLKKGKILELIGQWENCKITYETALQLAKKSRDALLLGQANDSLGRVLMLKGDYQEAIGYLQRAARLFESIEDKQGIATVFGNIGNLYFRQGNYHEAKSYLTQSIAIRQEDESVVISPQTVSHLGLTFMNQGDYDEGIRYQKAELEVCKRHNDKQGMATLYTNMGIVYFEKGDYDAALECYQKGLELSEELGNKMLTAIAIGCIGSVYERKGDYEQAMINFQKDLELVEELGDKQGVAIALGLIGELLSVKGDFHKAIEYLQKNLMLCEELGYQKGIAKALNTLGDVFYFTHQYDRSLYYYNKAIEVTRKINNRLVLGSSLVEKGLVLIEMGDLENLKITLEEALAVTEPLGNPDLLFEARILSARYHLLTGAPTQAKAIIEELLDDPHVSDDQVAAAYFELAKVEPDNNAYREKALTTYQQLFAATPRHVFRTRIEELIAQPSE